MFDIGFWEMAFIGLLALLILGPNRLPEAARTAGQWIGKLRTFITNVKQDLDSQLQSDELAELRRLKEELVQARETLQQTSESMVTSITDGMGEQMQEIESGSDFIDNAVSAPLPASNKKPRRKSGKPAVAKKKKAASKKTGKKTSARKKVSKKKVASKNKTTKSKTIKTRARVKSKKHGR